MLVTGSLNIMSFSVPSGFLRTGLPEEMFVFERRELWPHKWSLFLSCWLDWSILQPEWVTGAPQKVIKSTGAGVTPVLWKKGGIRGSDGSYQDICVAASKHREHLCNADSQWNKNTLELFGKIQRSHTWESSDLMFPMLWPVSLTRHWNFHFWSVKFMKR